MKLINVHTFELEDFADNHRPKYAILSHRWGENEITHQDMVDIRRDSPLCERPAFQKIKDCCDKALKLGLEHIWVDTCCIDAKSSAELSESINSMYRWYQESEICFAFLADVNVTSVPSEEEEVQEDDDGKIKSAATHGLFRQSAWFTRGWTLQELLAPTEVTFFNSYWRPLGNKQNLQRHISRITGIGQEFIDGRVHVTEASVAKRMSWASNRQTLRTEDMAYSLMGLFEINMPMLYGEGDKAFIRLQQEILKTSDDPTIFAWSAPPSLSYPGMATGLLAMHPLCFQESANFVPFRGLESDSLEIKSTNIGLSIEVYADPTNSGDIFSASLNCHEENDVESFATIELLTLDEARGHYIRTSPSSLAREPVSFPSMRICVRHRQQPVVKAQPARKWLKLTKKTNTSNWRIASVEKYCTDLKRNENLHSREQQDSKIWFQEGFESQDGFEDVEDFLYVLPQHAIISPAITLMLYDNASVTPAYRGHSVQLSVGSNSADSLCSGVKYTQQLYPVGYVLDRKLPCRFQLIDGASLILGLCSNTNEGIDCSLSTSGEHDQVVEVSLEIFGANGEGEGGGG